MADTKTFYITTPIYYVNSEPHVGSATTTLLCDVLARYRRLRGEPVFFLTGTDEHAQKVADAAAKADKSPQEFVDDVSQRFVDAWKFLNIANDDFIRTTEPRHKQVVVEVFKRLQKSGDIYPGQYEGWYSVSDETFLRDSEVKDGRSIESGAEVVRVAESVYYLKLSAYGDQLLQYIEDQPNFLQPETRKNEVIAFIKGGLRDLAISRRNTGWGIEVPGDPSQVIYVWFDACINYLSATGWPNSPDWNSLWPANVHLVGKEIYTRFHATLWPITLMALGLPLPETVLGHGWWLVEGEKGSKSKGNIPTPRQAVAAIIERSQSVPGTPVTEAAAIDALRYYLIRDISFTSDAEFSLENLAEKRYNADLANDLGNLLNRTLGMLTKYCQGVIPNGAASRTAQSTLAILARDIVQDVERSLLALDPAAALEAIWRLVRAANKEIGDSAPWDRYKNGDTDGVADALYAPLETARIVSILLAPFLPYTFGEIRAQLGITDAPTWADASEWGLLPAGTSVQEARPIFPRLPKESKPAMTQEPAAKAPVATEVPADTITIADFARVQIRVAVIKTAERIEGATKLLRLTINVGEETDRQLVAGIAETYDPETLPGRKIVVLANLQPAKIRGVVSQGMLLAATDTQGRAVLLAPDDPDIAPGAKVK